MRTAKVLLIAVLAAALLAVPALAAHKPAKGPYKTNVHVQMAAGYKGPIHAWDPVMVSIRGRGHSGERYDLCITPPPLEHARCYTHRRVNGPGVSTEFSKAGKTTLRFKLSTGKVITRKVRVVH